MTLLQYKSKGNIRRWDAIAVLRNNSFREVNALLATKRGFHGGVILLALARNPSLLTRKQTLKLILSALFGTSELRLSLVSTAMEFVFRMGYDVQLRAAVTRLWPRLDADRTSGYLYATGYCVRLGVGSVVNRKLTDPESWLALLPELFELNTDPDVRAALLFQVDEIDRYHRIPQVRQWACEWVQRMPDRREDYHELSRYQFIKKLKARCQRRRVATARRSSRLPTLAPPDKIKPPTRNRS